MIQPLAFLLLTSLTSVGLLATWAATSPRHWFLRTSVVAAVLSLLILIPAYEPLVAFVLQVAVVAAGVQLARWLQWRKESNGRPSPRARFSLASLMLVTVFVAIAAAVAVQLPALNFLAWQSVALIGVVAGIATLLGLWMVHGQQFRWWLRVLIGIFLALVVSPLLVFGDWFIVSTIKGAWPPIDDPLFQIFASYEEPPEITWVFIAVGITTISCVFLWLIAGVAKTEKSRRFNSRWKSILARCVLILIVVVFLIPPAGVYYQLMTPEPIPEVVLPDPNGWDDFVAAGVMVEKSKEEPILSNSDTATQTQLSTAVKATAPAFELLAAGLKKQAYCPIEYDVDRFTDMYYNQVWSLVRAVQSRSLLAETEGRFEDAADSALEGIRFGYEARRGGLMVDSLIGSACSGGACHSLYHVHKELSVSHCERLIAALVELEQQAEPDYDIVMRDWVWSQHAFGWHGHLCCILGDVDSSDSGRLFIIRKKERAVMRLLQVELALQAWRQTHDTLPEALVELVPEILKDVPSDPFDPSEGPLRYRRTNENNDVGYLLYSVGCNTIDDNGAVPYRNGNLNLYVGDLRLDVMFAPEPEPSEEDEWEDGEMPLGYEDEE